MASSNSKQMGAIARITRLSATVHQHEAVRSAIRAGLATSLAYVASLILHAPDSTWAVISALYVLQTSVGGTVSMAIGRVISTGLGIVLGLGAVLIVGSAEIMELFALLVVVGIIAALGEFRPELRYGAVIASILIISPTEAGLFAEALDKAYAISLGSIIGALVGTFVFPVTAHHSALVHLATAMRDCSALIRMAFEPEARCGTKEWDDLHEAVGQELATTRDRLGQSRLMRHSKSSRPTDLLHSVDRLWHHLSMLDRMVSGGERDHGQEQLQLLKEARDASSNYMDELSVIVAEGEPGAVSDEASRRLEAVNKKWAAFDSEDDGTGDHQSAIVAFGWRQLMREIGRVKKAVESDS